MTVTVPAEIGFPPVFYQQGSVMGEELRAFLVKQGYTDAYHWDTADSNGSSKSNMEDVEDVATGEPSTISDSKISYIAPLAVVLVILLGMVTIHVVRTLRAAKGTQGDRVGAGDEVSERLLHSTAHEEL